MEGGVERIRTEDRQASFGETRLSCPVPSTFAGRVPGSGRASSPPRWRVLVAPLRFGSGLARRPGRRDPTLRESRTLSKPLTVIRE